MVVPSTSSPDKAALRRHAREIRRRFVTDNPGLDWSPGAQDIDRLLDRDVAMASYRPVGSEADPSPIERLAARFQPCQYYPRVDDDGVMRFYAPQSAGLVRDSHGIDVPAADAIEGSPSLVLVPLLAFDRRGTRLGQGGGHYDRALARLGRAMTAKGSRLRAIGIAWAIQEVADLPRDPWDVPLDAIITEREWIVCR